MVGHKCVELVAAQMHTHTSQSPVASVAVADRELTGRQSRSRRGPSPQRASAARRHSPANVDRVRTSATSGKKDLAKHTSPAASPAFLRIRDWNSSKSCAHASCQHDTCPCADRARGGETHELSVAVVIEEVEELLEIAAPHAPICTDVVSTAGSHAERRKGDGQAAWRSRWTALSIRSADCEPRSGEPSVCDTVTSSGGIENAITCRRTVSWEACAASHDSVRVRTLPSLVSSLRSAGEPATVSSSTANFSCGSVPAVTESTDGWRESR